MSSMETNLLVELSGDSFEEAAEFAEGDKAVILLEGVLKFVPAAKA